jgi:hypothetical protein
VIHGDPAPDRRPDAVRAPARFSGGGDAHARLKSLHDAFAPLLGVPRLFVRLQGAEHFITGDPGDTLKNGAFHDQPDAPRYRWIDRGDGVLYGWTFDRDTPR